MKYILLRENLQQARKVLRELDIEETDPNFIEIRNLLGNNLGYLGMFTKLYYNFNYDINSLKRLKDILDKNRQLLKDLPKQVINYENVEELEDDLSIAKQWAEYRREFVRKLPSVLRSTARNDVDIKNVFVQLTDKQKEYIYKTFMKIISDYRDYDKFKNDLFDVVKSSNQELSELLQRIESEEHAYLIYNKDNIVIIEVYDHGTSCRLGTKSWCISRDNDGYYWDDYAGIDKRRKQYFIWNFNAPSTHLDRMLAVTVNKDGTIHHSQLMGTTPPINVPEYLEKYNIPSDIIAPLDLEEDLPKIKKLGFSPELIRLLIEIGTKITNDDLRKLIERFGFSPKVIKILHDLGELDKYIDQITKGGITKEVISELMRMGVTIPTEFIVGLVETEGIDPFSFSLILKGGLLDRYKDEILESGVTSSYLAQIDNSDTDIPVEFVDNYVENNGFELSLIELILRNKLMDRYLDRILELDDVSSIVRHIDRTGLDIPDKLIRKFINDTGFNKYVYSLMRKNNLMSEYSDKIPFDTKLIHGLLTDKELVNSDISEIRKIIHSTKESTEKEDFFNFCNDPNKSSLSASELKDEYGDSFYIEGIQSISIREKLYYIESNYDKFTQGGILVFLFNDMDRESNSYPIDVSFSSIHHIDIHIDISFDDFLSEVLDTDEFTYQILENLGNYYGDLSFDDTRTEESIIHYLDNEGTAGLIQFLGMIKERMPHIPYQEKIDECIEQVELGKYQDNMIIRGLLSVANSKYADVYGSNAISEFFTELENSAKQESKKDGETFEEHLVGEYNINSTEWILSMEELMELLDKSYSDIDEDISVDQWIGTNPLRLDDVDFLFIENGSDHPSEWVYMSLADNKPANRVLVDMLQDDIDSDFSGYIFNRDGMDDMFGLLSKIYEPISYTDSHREYWFGYQRKMTVGGSERTYIIPLTEITSEYINIYILSKPMGYYNGRFRTHDFSLDLVSMEYEDILTEQGIIIKKVSIEDFKNGNVTIDPSQLEFQFERIKSFNSYWKLK